MSKHIDKSRFPQNPNVGDVFYADTLDMSDPPVGWRSTGIWVDIRSDEMGITYRYDGIPAGLYWVRHKDGTVGVVEYEGDGCWQAMGSDNLWRVGDFAAILGPVQSQDQVAALEAIRDEQAETIADQAEKVDRLNTNLDIADREIERLRDTLTENHQRAEEIIGAREQKIRDLQADLESASEVDEAVIEVLKRQIREQQATLDSSALLVHRQIRQIRDLTAKIDRAKPLYCIHRKLFGGRGGV